MEYNLLLSHIQKELEGFIQKTVADPLRPSDGIFLRIKACLHQPHSLGTESNIVEDAILVSPRTVLQNEHMLRF
jgi:hypothetical protein